MVMWHMSREKSHVGVVRCARNRSLLVAQVPVRYVTVKDWLFLRN